MMNLNVLIRITVNHFEQCLSKSIDLWLALHHIWISFISIMMTVTTSMKTQVPTQPLRELQDD
jgi:hypothetical protein